MTDTSAWISAEQHPAGQKGLWTPDVVAVTNLGNVFKLAFFHGEESGVWQRPKAFMNGERVEWWTPMPK